MSELFSNLLRGSKSTHIYTLGDKTIPLTPTGLTPSELIKKLHDNGATLIALGETEHTEFRIASTVSAILADKSLKIKKFAAEYNTTDYPAYTAFLNGNNQPLKDLVNNPNDSHAPDEKKYPELRKQYYAENWKVYETTKGNGIKVAFIDHADTTTRNEANYAHNKTWELKRNYVIATIFRDDKGKPIDIERMPSSEFDKYRPRIAQEMEAAGLKVSQKAIDQTPPAQFATITKGFFNDIGLEYAAAHTPETLRKATQEKYDSLHATKFAAEKKRDDLRNAKMHDNIIAFTQQGNPNDLSVLMMGTGHFGERNKTDAPSLEQLLRKSLGSKIERIDIVPVSAADAKKLGVAIGGKNGAAYTIFIEGATSAFNFKDTGKSIPAKDGPHKDKLKPLKLSQNELSAPQFAVTDIPEEQPITSGLSAALPKTLTTKTI